MATLLLPFPPNLQSARFLRRENRFRVRVLWQGREVPVHLPNSGRLHELLLPGRQVYILPREGPHRKTVADLILVEVDGRLVSVDARLPPRLFLAAWREGRFPWLPFHPQAAVQNEPRCGHGRLDLHFRFPQGPEVWVETKSVTWVEAGRAYFPDAPTDRGRRHLACLEAKAAQGHRALVAFMIQRDDAQTFSPHPADPDFPQALYRAAQAGVEVYAFAFHVSRQGMAASHPVPVVWPEGLTAAPDR